MNAQVRRDITTVLTALSEAVEDLGPDEAAAVTRRERLSSPTGRRPVVKHSEPSELAKARAAVQFRSRGRCEARTDVCTSHGQHVHHKGGRTGPDAHKPESLLNLCFACHAWIHAHPEASYAAGWMTKRLGGAA